MEASEVGPSDAADLSDVDSEASFGLASSGADSDEDREFRGLEAGDANENSGADDASSASGDTSGSASGEDDSGGVAEEEPLLCGCCQEELTHIAPADEWLVCDGGCRRSLPPTEERFVCTVGAERCDWDVCRPCGGVTLSYNQVEACADVVLVDRFIETSTGKRAQGDVWHMGKNWGKRAELAAA